MPTSCIGPKIQPPVEILGRLEGWELTTWVGYSRHVLDSLLATLGRLHEPETWSRLSEPVQFDQPIESMEDLKSVFTKVGLSLRVDGRVNLQGRLNAGVRMDLRRILGRLIPEGWRFVSEGTRLRLMDQNAAFEYWCRRLGTK